MFKAALFIVAKTWKQPKCLSIDAWIKKIWNAHTIEGFPGSSNGKESACNAGDRGSIPGLGRSPGGGHSNALQYSCLENPHGQRTLVGYSPWVAKSQTRLRNKAQHCTAAPLALNRSRVARRL